MEIFQNIGKITWTKQTILWIIPSCKCFCPAHLSRDGSDDRLVICLNIFIFNCFIYMIDDVLLPVFLLLQFIVIITVKNIISVICVITCNSGFIYNCTNIIQTVFITTDPCPYYHNRAQTIGQNLFVNPAKLLFQRIRISHYRKMII